MITPTELT
jgi:hypothetical protein